MHSADKPTNRLARESSPYLLLHAGNPVDWFPWGPEAIAKARAEDKPLFLSVGYSTCYWCHVMERESFSDPSVAAEMNRHFVNVKVDREERPDLDEVYMLATQILAGQGGWPNSVFLTPELEPFFAGTYFPPQDGHGRPGFPTVLRSMIHAWQERRSEVEEQAGELAEAIRRHLDEIEPAAGPLPGGELALRSLAGLRQRFDATWGGFGERPKFPTPSNLWLLFAVLEGTVGAEAGATEQPASSMMLDATLGAMARGGLYDQLAGGFHRYATDREWRIPHFEKMLYDNGLLLELYAREHSRGGKPEPARIAVETARWLGREMTSPDGAFWSAIDAETGGREGAYYVWTRAELDGALGGEDAEYLAPLWGFDGEPFFEDDRYVLHLPRPLDVQAGARRTTREALLAEIDPLRARLLSARDQRPRPATDDKILADWNGTAIAGLAVAARVLTMPKLLQRAERAADFVLASLRSEDGTLLHAWRRGEGRIAAFLSDYVFLVRGLLRLHEASGDSRWLAEAGRVQEEQERRLASPHGGYYNAAEAADLLIRGKEVFDGALPAANGVAALNLLELHAATGDDGYALAAERTLRAFSPVVEMHPDGARTFCVALAAFESSAAPNRERVSAPGSTAVNLSEAGRAAIDSPALELEGAPVDGWQPFVLRFRVRSGWHLEVGEGIPALSGVGAAVANLEWPTGMPLAGGRSGEPRLPVFEGRLEVRGRLRRDSPRAALLLRFVACGEERCLPPTEIEVAIP